MMDQDAFRLQCLDRAITFYAMGARADVDPNTIVKIAKAFEKYATPDAPVIITPTPTPIVVP
jgi:hypothetical protein